jgi:ERCC4-type nuclease
MALDVGDFSTDKIIFERKKTSDLVNSIFARYGKPSRLQDQCERLFQACHDKERLPWLLITGKISDVEEEFKKRGQKLNRAAVYGAVASVMVRYDISILWTEQVATEWLPEIKSIAEKVDEGKYLMPHRKSLSEFATNRRAAAICRALDLTPKVSEILQKRFGSLYGVLEAAKSHQSDILVLEGISTRTLRKIQEIGGLI